MSRMRVLLPTSLVDEMKHLASTQPNRNEVGGLLLGKRKTDAIEIVQITPPQKRDVGTPTLFRRSIFGHQRLAAKAWEESGGYVNWVGEWHSHPFGSPTPSWIDRNNWKRIAKHAGMPMAFAIIGAKSEFISVTLPNGNRVTGLSIVDQDNLAALYG